MVTDVQPHAQPVAPLIGAKSQERLTVLVLLLAARRVAKYYLFNGLNY